MTAESVARNELARKDETVGLDIFCLRCGKRGGMAMMKRSELPLWRDKLCHDCKSSELSFKAALDAKLDQIADLVVAKLKAEGR